MGRRKVIAIEKELSDPVVEAFLKTKPSEFKKAVPSLPKSKSKTTNKLMKMAEKLYKEEGEDEEKLSGLGLFDLQEAYDYLRDHGVRISFRALGGRIERGKIPSVKIGRKRYIMKDVLDALVGVNANFYSVRQAYKIYSKIDPKMNYRAFVGRIEKNSIPSVKIGGRRYIPKKVIDTLLHLKENYYTVSEALNELSKHGISINRNAFERRLDRGRIPHYKVGGRRFIPKDVFQDVLKLEMNRRK